MVDRGVAESGRHAAGLPGPDRGEVVIRRTSTGWRVEGAFPILPTDTVDDLGHALVLVVHEVHDAQRLRQVDLLRSRVALLGDARIDDSGGHGVGREKLGRAHPGIRYRPPSAWANLPAAVRHWQANRS